MNGWMDRWLERPVAVIAWAVAVILAGIWTAFHIPLEWAPNVELPEVRIRASWPGASPAAVERYVTAPMERAVQNVLGTESVESLSEEGVSTVVLGVSRAVELGPYVTEVNEQLALLRGVLPARVHPRLTKEVPAALREEQGFMTLQLTGSASPDALRMLAEEEIAPRLRSLPDISDVGVEGGTQREVRVTLHPDRMAAYGVRSETVRRFVQEAVTDASFGRFRDHGRTVLLMSPAEGDVEGLRQLVVGPSGTGAAIRLREVADVVWGAAPVRSISRIDGQSVVTLTLDRARESHMLEVARAVERRVVDVRADLPTGMQLLIAADRSEEVRSQLHDLAWRGGLGLLLVVLVLLFMLRSVRAVAVVIFAVAASLAVALSLMAPLGLTLNLLTIAGLVLVFGLLIDNAVIVVEQLMRADRASSYSVIAALKAVWLPLVGGTLSTIVVMLPLVYLSGELLALFLPFGVLVGLTLIASLASAGLLVPVLGRFLPRSSPRRIGRSFAAPFLWASRFPASTLLGLLLLLGIPFWMFPVTLDEPEENGAPARLVRLYNKTIGSEGLRPFRAVLEPALGGILRPFAQEVDFGRRWHFESSRTIVVSLRFPPGTPIERSDRLVRPFEEIAGTSSSVEKTIVRISERQAIVQVQISQSALPTPEPYELRERLILHAAQLAGIDVSIVGLVSGGYYSTSGSGISNLTVQAYGPNYQTLGALSDRFAERIAEGSRRVATVNTNAGRFGFEEGREVLRLRWTPDDVARTGVPANVLAGFLRPVLATRFPDFYADLDGASKRPVRITVAGATELDATRLTERPIVLGDSLQIRLAGTSNIRLVETPSAIERRDQQYKRYISIDFRGPPRMASAFIQEEIDRLPLPPGYRFEAGGAAFFSDEVQRTFGWIIAATILLVFLVTAAVFESWRLSLVVVLSVPLALVGIAAGFLATGAPFAEGAFIGAVLLVGIAINDSILLVDRYRDLRQRRPWTRASVLVRLAVKHRLRPMWTTTLTTVASLMPLLIFPDGSDFWTGLAVIVTSGLLASTLLAPLATVALVSVRRRMA